MLTDQAIREILKAPKQKVLIQEAVSHEQRLSFHTEVALSASRVSPYYNTFLRDCQGKLKPDKYRLMLSLVRLPVKTVPITKKVFDDLAKVFDGQNPVYKYEFTAPEYLDDWLEYSNGYKSRWKKDGLANLKSSVNSIVICDLPDIQTSTLPEPYWFYLDIANVIDFASSDGCDIDWIIYRKDDHHVVIMDDKSYKVWYWERNQDPINAREISTAPHDLGYCPAHFSWPDCIDIKNPCLKKSPLSTHLEELDWLLFYMYSERVLDMYATYPIVWGYKKNCTYRNETAGNGLFEMCDNGFLQNGEGKYYTSENGGLRGCPVCNDHNASGPGTFIGVPAPVEGVPDMTPPAGFIQADITSLEFVLKKQKELSAKIRQEITGYVPDPINDKAVNEKQVRSMIEEPQAILNDLKKNFEKVINWTESTIARLRYGAKFLGSMTSLGTQWYLMDADSILALYEKSLLAGTDGSILDKLQDQYHATIFKNNPDQLQEYNISKNLKPIRHISDAKAIELAEKNFISQESLVIILHFSTFELRFKREQASFIEFGKNLAFDVRIKKIKEIFNQYARELIQSREPAGEQNS